MLLQRLENDIRLCVVKIFKDFINSGKKVEIDLPPEKIRNTFHFSTNIGMIIAKEIGKSLMESAELVALEMKAIDSIESIEVMKPGFVNFTVKKVNFYEIIRDIINNKDKNLIKKIGNNEKINIEFVSANPTGPMHLGHTRGAIVGDVLANIFQKLGYNVTREYLINDAGSQIDTLLESFKFRYEQELGLRDKLEKIPEGCYPGDYLIDIARKMAASTGDNKALELNNKIDKKKITEEMMILIKDTLEKMKIKYDVFVSEQTLRDKGMLDKAEQELINLGMIYSGQLDKPKGHKVDENWKAVDLSLIKTKQFGDDSDRPIRKRDGSWAYIAPDVAYHKDKFDRGFKKMLVILGSDHKGYVKRLKATTKAVTNNKAEIDIKLCEIVNFMKDGQAVKMSKRKGNFLTVNDVLDEIDIDILRFTMLTRKSETVLNFDFALAKEQTKNNPVFYVQYAYSRCCSILKNGRENDFEPTIHESIELNKEYQELLCLISLYNKFVTLSACHYEPFFLVNYLITLATKWHSIWNYGVENGIKFIQIDNRKQTENNLAIVQITKTILANGLNLLSIKTMERM